MQATRAVDSRERAALRAPRLIAQPVFSSFPVLRWEMVFAHLPSEAGFQEPSRSGVLLRERLPRVGLQQRQRPQHDVPGNLQTLRTELVDRVLGGVMEGVVVAVVKINEVHHGNADALEGQMIV